MRFRKIRKIGRWYEFRCFTVVAMCFILGTFIGMSCRLKTNNSAVLAAFEIPGERIAEWMNKGDNVELLGRKKLSLKSEKQPEPFSKLPPSFERNIYPPRAHAKRFNLEPHTVLERYRDQKTWHSDYFMLILVKSSPVHSTRREVIRRTWGAVKEVDGLKFNTIFLLGSVGDNAPLQLNLEQENSIHGDILQSDSPEGYRNLPRKVLSAMQWLVLKSSEITSDFYTFTDDDCVLHIANIVDFFRSLSFTDVNENTTTYNNDELGVPATSHDNNVEDIVKDKITPALIHSVKVPPNIAIERRADFLGDDSNLKLSKMQELQEPFDIEDVMDDPNAKIQIERTGREEGVELLMQPEKVNETEADTKSTPVPLPDRSYNERYRGNARNLKGYLKLALPEIQKPGSIFARRRLEPDGLYCGYCYDRTSKPHRNLNTKWGVSMEAYSEELYPAFCHGGMYTMSGYRLASIFSVSTVTEFSSFHLEDVLITGILREKSGSDDSNLIRRGSDPRRKPLMYYVWDTGPRTMFKMSRKWRFFTQFLLSKRFVMEAVVNGKLIRWNNFERPKALQTAD